MVEDTPIRMTQATRMVLQHFLSAPGEVYGFEIAKATGLASGALYPILGRLEERGFVTSRWEQPDDRVAGRPPRRYYQLTEGGATARRWLERRP